MRAQISADPAELASLACTFLERDPFTTNVIAVRLAAAVAGIHPPGAADIWGAVLDGDDVVGLAMHTPPRPVFVSRMPAPGAAAVADALYARHEWVDGVIGESSSAGAFADAWTLLTGRSSTVVVSELMYRLDRLRPPAGVPGWARPAGAADAHMVVKWLRAFHEEAVPHEPTDGLAEMAERQVAAGQIVLWSDRGEPVSLAGYRAPAAGVSRIGPVFTPAVHRRHGYGAAVTAAATERALERGARHVVLYADLANPTSNGVYRRVGYVPDHEAREHRFTPS